MRLPRRTHVEKLFKAGSDEAPVVLLVQLALEVVVDGKLLGRVAHLLAQLLAVL